MMRNISLLARLGVWFSVVTIPALSPAASVIFSNLGPGSTYSTSQGNPIGNAFDGNNYAEADTFALSDKAIFTSVRIALSCFATCASPFSVTLNQDAGNQPGAVLETFTVSGATLEPLGASNPPLVLNSVLNPTLSGGSRYWISVSADPTDSIAWNLNVTGDSSTEALSTDGGANWFSPSGNTPGAFEVNGITPEPASLGLMLGAGLVLAIVRQTRAGDSRYMTSRPQRDR